MFFLFSQPTDYPHMLKHYYQPTNQPIITTKQQHCNCAFTPNWLPTPPTAALLNHVACGSVRRAQVAWHYHTLIHALATAATVSASAPAATTAADPAGALGSSSLATGKRKEQCRIKGRRERFDSLLSHFSYIYYAPHSYLFQMLCKLNSRLESPLIVTIMQLNLLRAFMIFFCSFQITTLRSTNYFRQSELYHIIHLILVSYNLNFRILRVNYLSFKLSGFPVLLGNANEDICNQIGLIFTFNMGLKTD